MKPNNRILKKALTIVGALFTSATITTAALAVGWEAPNDNTPIFGKEYTGVNAYGWGDYEAHLSWRINLYVSTLADGSANPSSSSFTTESGLKRVGSIIYTNETSSGRNILLQTEYTDKSRYDPSIYTTTKWGKTIFKIPETVQLGAYNTGSEFGNSDGYDRVYIRTGSLGDTIKLPTKYTSSLSCAKDIDPVISNVDTTNKTETFIWKVMHNLEDAMGSQLSINIKNALHPGILQKINDYANELYKSGMPAAVATEKAVERLYPTSDEPLVAYVLTAVPMISYTALADAGSFWFWGSSAYKINGTVAPENVPDIVPIRDQKISLVLDAYGTEKYNAITKAIYANPAAVNYLEGRGVYARNYNGASSTYSNGQLDSTFGTTLTCYVSNVASVSGNGQPTYFGFTTNPDGAIISSRELGCQKGGLALAHFDIEDDESLPINYYTRTYTITEDQLKEDTGKDTLPTSNADQLKLINNLDLSYSEAKVSKSLEKTVKSYTPVGDSNIAGIPVAEQSLAELKDTPKYTKQISPTAIATYGSPTKPLTKVTNTLTITDKVKEVDVLSVKLVLETEDVPDTPSSSSSRPDDRIKTMDVTQLITVDQNSTGQISIHKTVVNRT